MSLHRASLVLVPLLALGLAGCEESPPPPAQPAAQGPQNLEGRHSTLGKAYDAAERTAEKADEYNAALEKQIDEMNKDD